MKDFAGKNVYITGGSSGIGLSTAKLLAAAGAHISVFARGRERLESASQEIRSLRRSENQGVSWTALDVSRKDQVDQVMATAVGEFGAPDLLINCAGRAYPRYFEDITYEQFDETMRTNFFGVWHTVSALVPHMKERGGHIVNVSSMSGFVGVFGYTDYAASKFAIIGFSEALRSELRRYGIRVSVLCPPDTDTPGFQVENRTKPEETQAVSAAARVMRPDDVAKGLIQGIRKGKFLIIPNFEGRMIYLVKRVFPSLLDRIMDRDIRKVHRARKRRSGGPCSEIERQTGGS
jgi:NAD(P)-dependent dehydrogenase (short-subunit alcohol dehydrogenase family)